MEKLSGNLVGFPLRAIKRQNCGKFIRLTWADFAGVLALLQVNCFFVPLRQFSGVTSLHIILKDFTVEYMLQTTFLDACWAKIATEMAVSEGNQLQEQLVTHNVTSQGQNPIGSASAMRRCLWDAEGVIQIKDVARESNCALLMEVYLRKKKYNFFEKIKSVFI